MKNILLYILLFLIIGCAPRTDQHFYDNVKIGMTEKEFRNTFYYLEGGGDRGGTSFSNYYTYYKLPSGKMIFVSFRIPHNEKEFKLESYKNK